MVQPSFTDLVFEPYLLSKPCPEAAVTMPRLTAWALRASNFLSGRGWKIEGLSISLVSPGFVSMALFDNGYALRAETLFFPERMYGLPYLHCQLKQPLEESTFLTSFFFKDLTRTQGAPQQARLVRLEAKDMNRMPETQKQLTKRAPFTGAQIETAMRELAALPDVPYARLPLVNDPSAPPPTCRIG